MIKKIILGTDHAGFELKEEIKKFLVKQGYKVEDKGAYSYNPDDDYPEFILAAAQEVAKDENFRGIILGGSGQGEAIVANKVKGIRAAIYYGSNIEIIKKSRTHNNANILSLGARSLPKDEALKAVKLWLDTDFENNERHARRIKQIKDMEKNLLK